MGKRRRPRGLAERRGNLFVLLRSRVFYYLLIAGLILVAVFFTARSTAQALMELPYFKIKTVSIDRAASFINRRDLDSLNGKNIFVVDLKMLQRSLSLKYPQMAQVRILKKFPSTIQVVAKKRRPFAQAAVLSITDRRGSLASISGAKTVFIDEQGSILALTLDQDKPLPLITGVSHRGAIVPGFLLGGEDVQVALNIIKVLQDNTSFSSYNLTKIDIGNLLNIILYLSNDLKIIVDKINVERQIKTLELVLSQGNLKEQNIKYIDLRFKEPILGTK